MPTTCYRDHLADSTHPYAEMICVLQALLGDSHCLQSRGALKEMDFSIALSAMFGRFGRGHVLT